MRNSQSDSPTLFRCPGCKKTIARAVESFPFCSERCRITDLGHWAGGDYRIAGEAANIPTDTETEY